ncbi:MAG: 30S ribosomal protein S20 [Planctomycetaceae bacterium]|jgi:small subunit ribosomal protein S20|nr:MAG: 30S ribosomal protein S20 [Planctomycetaceae bacterium]
MPNTSTAKKRLRQNDKRRARNRARRSSLRTQIRKVRAAIAAGNVEVATTEFRLAAKRLDQAASTKLIHANTAARLKSRLVAAIKKSQAVA